MGEKVKTCSVCLAATPHDEVTEICTICGEGTTDILRADEYLKNVPKPVLRMSGYLSPDAAAALEQDRRVKRDGAKRQNHSEFLAECGWHASVVHDTATGACLLCVAEAQSRGLPVALAYRLAGGDRYPDGATLRYVASGQDVTQFDSYGRPRAIQSDNPRAEARRAGLKTYKGTCSTCNGAKEHSVKHGKCLSCFNTLGYPRVNPAP